MTEIKTHSTTNDNVTRISAQGLGSPVGVKDPDKCGIMPEYLQGAICYRVCGEIPEGREPRQVEFLTRASYQGEGTPWETCGDDGCAGGDFEFDPESSRICGLFKLWRGDGSHRDLMMKVSLS